ncbi:MAG: hypothetical protein B6D36_00285 [Planctomycetes bacterium UTPLA1]|jgi:hypothetical protein|nr:MAG: hypothetical protein B6D36_00285 [Planctomycetes bacterium UTPLA1]
MPAPLSKEATQLLTLKTHEDVARFFGYPNYVSLQSLIYPRPLYTSFVIPKRTGSIRIISAPRRRIKDVQRLLSTALLDLYGHGRKPVHSFMKGRSVVTNARQHAQSRFVLRVDLRDFFGSIHFGRVRGVLLNRPFALPEPVATVLAHICCLDGKLPQGAPTSPIISNLVCRGLDTALMKLAGECRATYTRYCDDLVFSFSIRQAGKLSARIVASEGGVVGVGHELETAIKREGFEINVAKTRLYHYGARQTVTGLVVNEFPNVSKKYYRSLRTALYAWEKHGYESASLNVPGTIQHRRYRSGKPRCLHRLLWGKLQYMRMVKGERDASLISLVHRFNRLLARDAAVVEKPVPPAIHVKPTVARAKDARAGTWMLEAITHRDTPDELLNEGTAFYVRGVGFITCAHCLLNTYVSPPTAHNEFFLHSHDRRYKYQVTPHQFDYGLDLAVLAPDSSFVENEHLAFEIDPALPAVGTAVVLCGYPGNSPSRPPVIYQSDVSRTVTVSGVSRIEIDKPVHPGSSGGPLLSALTGKVLGVVATFKKGDAGADAAIAIAEISRLGAPK